MVGLSKIFIFPALIAGRIPFTTDHSVPQDYKCALLSSLALLTLSSENRRSSINLSNHSCESPMGPKDKADSVVDSTLQLHGISGLRVADTSIIPTKPAASTNASALMIGERAADFALGRQPLPTLEL